eukprot:1158421-Pelagomonas_calceolata.AAC.19
MPRCTVKQIPTAASFFQGILHDMLVSRKPCFDMACHRIIKIQGARAHPWPRLARQQGSPQAHAAEIGALALH